MSLPKTQKQYRILRENIKKESAELRKKEYQKEKDKKNDK